MFVYVYVNLICIDHIFSFYIAIVGPAVIDSAVGWLNASQIQTLLLAAEANMIPVSSDPAPNGITGLFVYN